MKTSIPSEMFGKGYEPVKKRRDILTPALVITALVVAILFAWALIANAQTSKTPINNGILQSDLNAAGYKITNGNLVDYAGVNITWNTTTKKFDATGGGAGAVTSVFTRTGAVVAATNDYTFAQIGSKPTTLSGYGITDGGNVSNSGTPTAAQKATWVDATHIQGVTDNALQWDGGSTSLVAATGRTSLGATTTGSNLFTLATPGATSWLEVSNAGVVTATNAATTKTDLGLVIGTNVQAYDLDLDTWATLTPSANFQTMVPHTFAQMQTDLGLVIGTNVQAADADLTSWAAITRASGIDTFVATPSSANLRAALTDENGTGVALFNGATTPDFTTGFTIGGAAASGKFLQGDGTKYAASAAGFPTGVATNNRILVGNGTDWAISTCGYPSSTTAGKIIQASSTNFVASTATWPTTNTAGYKVQGDGTNYVSYPTDLEGSSTASVSAGYAADTYLAGSTITVAAGDWKAQGQYHCRFDMTKTGAGTATPIITVRMGTLGTTGDASIGALTFAAGTGVADTGIFDIDVVFRTVGSGTSAVIQMMGECAHNLAATGLTSTGAAGNAVIVGTSAGFASTTQTKLGISFNGGSSFSGTNTIVTAALHQP